MKTYFTFLILVGFLTTQVYATPVITSKSKAPKVTLAQQLARYIVYPDVLKPTQQAGVVVIQFRVNSADELCQLAVFSQNENLNNDLLRQLTGKKLAGYGSDTTELYTVRLRFKPE